MILNNLNKVMESYKPDESIWREYNDDMLLLKRAMNSLSDADRIIFVLYCEYGSLRKVGKQLGVSHSIIYKNISRIKQQIYDFVRTNSDNCNSGLLDRFVRVCGDSKEVDMEMVEE
jgi:DNA-directed RNA polymerase specialized sigma subunit